MTLGSSSLGCRSGEVDRLADDVEVDLTEYPALQTVGETVTIDVDELALPLAITRRAEGGDADAFIVTGTECNHANCGVVRKGDGWHCPCHGSSFALDGRLLEGPATESLASYEYEIEGDVMTVFADG